MIIKILKLDQTNDFWMCDNVEDIHVEEIRPARTNGNQEGGAIRPVACSIYADFGSEQRRTWAIDFKRKDERFIAFFNTIAYLCNDNGKTIESIVG